MKRSEAETIIALKYGVLVPEEHWIWNWQKNGDIRFPKEVNGDWAWKCFSDLNFLVEGRSNQVQETIKFYKDNKNSDYYPRGKSSQSFTRLDFNIVSTAHHASLAYGENDFEDAFMYGSHVAWSVKNMMKNETGKDRSKQYFKWLLEELIKYEEKRS